MRSLFLALALLLGAVSQPLAGMITDEPDRYLAAVEDDAGAMVRLDEPAAPTIWLATIDPGIEYWSRFGHNALIVVPAGDAPAISYNFGYFDFHQPRFLRRFLRGRVHYQSLALPAARDLPGYAAEDRSVHLQVLALSPAQAQHVAATLAKSIRPEHRDYLYDYFTANCSTRLRDALDAALGGTLNQQTIGRSRGMTYRMHAVRLAEGDFWLALGIDLGLGPYADRPLSFWQEMFIPELMRRHLREVIGSDGEALITSETTWFDSGQPAPPELPSDRYLSFALTGLALAALLLWLRKRTQTTTHPDQLRRRSALLRGLGFSLHLVFGLAGLILLLLWLATDHVAAHGNENLLLLNPLSLLLAPLWLRRRRGPIGTTLAVLIAASAGFALASKSLPDFFNQANLHWCLLLLPVHLALLRAWWPPTNHNKM